jgi:hypothetical protein
VELLGVEPYEIVVLVQLDAPAVELCFVDPAVGCGRGSTGRVIRYFPRQVLSSVVDTHRRTIVPELLGSWPLGLGL